MVLQCCKRKPEFSFFKDGKIEELWGNGAIQNGKENFEASNKILKQVLLFNCMEMRDPQILLPRLVNTCATSGIHFSKALFVPSMSNYNKDSEITSGASVSPSEIILRTCSGNSPSREFGRRLSMGKVNASLICSKSLEVWLSISFNRPSYTFYDDDQ
ncbi:hypothetical protein HHK36_031510 [Tetracentron sinense]|uniref:Uncharacterized protein n=1 Tax=Tetracentron sinense TaxID=13715 RepID=A0A834Y6S6_TETSI|nr:hypothetical protein HHK36_031510 [Tetracentron sinense]